MKSIIILALLTLCAVGAEAQTVKVERKSQTAQEIAATVASKTGTPIELAKAALAAHGGDKFKNMKSLTVSGTAEVSGSPSMTFPAPFVIIYAGDKYRLEISAPIFQFKQIYDGEQTYSSAGRISLPPVNRLGLPLLPKIEEKDYTVSALPQTKKKRVGFRIVSPEGFYTDFFVDEKSGQVKGYEASYEIDGKTITTAVEIDQLREVEGVLVPEKYAQRFETGNLTIYAKFKAKNISVNSVIADDVFTMK